MNKIFLRISLLALLMAVAGLSAFAQSEADVVKAVRGMSKSKK